MGLFDRFRRRPPPDALGPDDALSRLCYGMAYSLLPQMFARDPAQAVDLFERGGPFLYGLACSMQEIEPDPLDAAGFAVFAGELGETREYLALEYPTPPPLDPRMLDPEWALTSGAVLAPYFSVLVIGEETLDYYVLGQRPGGGTTLRAVTPEANFNLGEGPTPKLPELLAAIARR